ncbi:MAG: hypothetical protein U0003_00555 [Vampirovibrionales bacterium]
MIIPLGLGLASQPRGLSVIPSTRQAAGEFFYDFAAALLSTAGERGDGYLFFIGSLFLLILTANLMGQLPQTFLALLPQGELRLPLLISTPTSALALISLVMYTVSLAIKRTGPKRAGF